MTETQQTNNTTTITPTRINKADMIRELLTSGVPPTQVARDVGCKPQYVYGVIAYERKKVAKLKAKAKSTPKRKYVKSGKYAKAVPAPTTPVVELDRDQLKAEQAELHELTAQFIQQLQEATKPKIQYIEIEVPQPHYNLTWKQRFTALFFGRV
jgi:transposase-like protein